MPDLLNENKIDQQGNPESTAISNAPVKQPSVNQSVAITPKTQEDIQYERQEQTDKLVRSMTLDDSQTTIIDGSTGSVTTKTPEQRLDEAAERDRLRRQKEAEDNAVLNNEPAPAPVTEAPVKRVRFSLEERGNIMRAFEDTGKYSMAERREMSLTLRRIERGEADSTDYARLQAFMEDAPWRTEKAGFDGTTRVNRSGGGSAAEASIANVLRRASVEVYPELQKQEFESGKDMTEFIQQKTGLPGSVVLDRLAMQELTRARKLGISNPAMFSAQFPVLASMQRIAQREQAQIDLQNYNDKKAIDYDYEMSLGRKYSGIPSASTGAFEVWAASNGYNAKDPSTVSAYGNAVRNGEVPYAVDKTGKLVTGENKKTNPWESFTSTETTSKIHGTPWTVIKEYDDIAWSKKLTGQQYKDGLIRFIAKSDAYSGVSAATAERELSSYVDQATQKYVGMISAGESNAMLKKLDAVSGRVSQAQQIQGSFDKAFPVSKDIDGVIEIMDKEEYILNVLTKGGADESLLDEAKTVMYDGTGNPAVSNYVGALGMTYSKLKEDKIRSIAEMRLAHPHNASTIYSESEAYYREDGIMKLSSDLTSSVKKADAFAVVGGKSVPVINTSNMSVSDRGMLYSVLKFTSNPKNSAIPESIQTILSEVFTSSQIAGDYMIQLKGVSTPENIPIFDGASIVDTLKGRGIKRIPLKEEMDYAATFVPREKIPDIYYITESAYTALMKPEESISTMFTAERIAGDDKKEGAAQLIENLSLDLFKKNQLSAVKGKQNSQDLAVIALEKIFGRRKVNTGRGSETPKEDDLMIDQYVRVIFSGRSGSMIADMISSKDNSSSINAGIRLAVSEMRTMLLSTSQKYIDNTAIALQLPTNVGTPDSLGIDMSTARAEFDQAFPQNGADKFDMLPLSWKIGAAIMTQRNASDAAIMFGKYNSIISESKKNIDSAREVFDKAGIRTGDTFDKNEAFINDIDAQIKKAAEYVNNTRWMHYTTPTLPTYNEIRSLTGR